MAQRASFRQHDAAGSSRFFHRGEDSGNGFAGAGFDAAGAARPESSTRPVRGIIFLSEVPSGQLPSVRPRPGDFFSEQLPKFIRRSLSNCACRNRITIRVHARSAFQQGTVRLCSAGRRFGMRDIVRKWLLIPGMRSFSVDPGIKRLTT